MVGHKADGGVEEGARAGQKLQVAWKTLLVGGLAQFVLVVLRVPILGTQLGVSPTAIRVGILVIGLLLGVARLKGPSAMRVFTQMQCWSQV